MFDERPLDTSGRVTVFDAAGRLVVQLCELHCRKVAEGGNGRVAMFHGPIVSFDVDGIQESDAVYRIEDRSGLYPMVLTGCRLDMQAQESEVQRGQGARQHWLLIAFRYDRIVSLSRWEEEQRPVSL